MAVDHFYYNSQIKNYLIQFMNVFAGLQVKVGKKDTREAGLIPVPVHYGSRDRVAASILSANTQNKPIRLPTMSTYLTGIELAPELRKGIGNIRRESYLPRGGVLPDDVQVVRQYMPIPYRAMAEVSIYTSNMDQHFQVLEQLFMMFDPILQIQTNDSTFDWTKITTVELVAIRFDENYPAGTDKRMIVTGLDFSFPIYISAPADLRNEIVRDIHVRIATLDYSDPMPTSGDDFDGLTLDYDMLLSTDDLVLP